jgi:hypothetical protein
MNRMKSVRFPVKGVSGLSLIFSRVFVVVAVDFSAMVLVLVSLFVSKFLCQYRFSVSRYQVCQVSSSQGLEVSVYQSVKVLWYQCIVVSRCRSAL